MGGHSTMLALDIYTSKRTTKTQFPDLLNGLLASMGMEHIKLMGIEESLKDELDIFFYQQKTCGITDGNQQKENYEIVLYFIL